MFEHPGLALFLAFLFILLSVYLYKSANKKEEDRRMKYGQTLKPVKDNPASITPLQNYVDVNPKGLIYFLAGFFVLLAVWTIFTAFANRHLLEILSLPIGAVYIWIAKGIVDKDNNFRKGALIVLFLNIVYALGTTNFIGVVIFVAIIFVLYHPRIVEVFEI